MKAAGGREEESKSSEQQGGGGGIGGEVIHDMLVATKVTDSCRRWRK